MLLGDLFKELINGSGSDLHLVSGSRPRLRFNGELKDAESWPAVLEGDDVWKMFESFLTETQKRLLDNRQDVNRSIVWQDDSINARFRACIFWDRCGLSAALRLIPTKIPLLSDLFHPELEATFRSFANRRRGLVLVVGATGSGKSTTVASMIDTINMERSERIFTIEDPIEYLHASKTSLISQREVGSDVDSYEQGGLSVMRADPDVVLIGELRTPEAVRIALAMAETGHLVFSTIHADSVSEAVRRLVESFPDNIGTMQAMLARSLAAVITQRLLPRANGKGRVAAHEIMIVTSKIRQMIAEGQTDLSLAIEAGRSEGMCTMDDSVIGLYRDGTISYDVACSRANDWKLLGPPPVKADEAVWLPVVERTSLGEKLVDKHVITEEELKNARQVEMSAPGDLGNIIQDLGYASEKDIAKVRASVLGLQYVDLKARPPSADALKSVPEHIVRRYNMIPIKQEGNRLMVAVSDVKAGMAGFDEVRQVSRYIIFPVLASRSDIEEAIQQYYAVVE